LARRCAKVAALDDAANAARLALRSIGSTDYQVTLNSHFKLWPIIATGSGHDLLRTNPVEEQCDVR
jgi:hypothetical protein